MKLSIITPSYNQYAFLKSTIDSVTNQNRTSIEYIIVDGNSTDGSQEIIDSCRESISHAICE